MELKVQQNSDCKKEKVSLLEMDEWIKKHKSIQLNLDFCASKKEKTVKKTNDKENRSSELNRRALFSRR